MKIIITSFVQNIQANKCKYRHPNGKTSNIDKRVAVVFLCIPKKDFEIVVEHIESV
jgi:hypothetical protein